MREYDSSDFKAYIHTCQWTHSSVIGSYEIVRLDSYYSCNKCRCKRSFAAPHRIQSYRRNTSIEEIICIVILTLMDSKDFTTKLWKIIILKHVILTLVTNVHTAHIYLLPQLVITKLKFVFNYSICHTFPTLFWG